MTSWSKDGWDFAPLPLAKLKGRTGLDVLQALLRGELPAPPICRALDFGLVEVEKGRAIFEGLPNREYANPFGAVHGGWTSADLDSCMACAVHTMLPADTFYTTLEFKLNLIRPVMPETGRVRAEGKIVHLGGRTATSEGRLTDAAGKLLAHGTETCLIFEASSSRV
ncbi:MAG: PaaI family thioesterase [Alphaproteobacteria bacterium]|nr:PaaI family thioesterase [Alphaproteobacteria bacterium]